ncbi:MAG: glycosyltransferase family protein [Bacteroidales bacterium]
MSEKENIKILLAPLNWGLGHASRIFSLIKEIERQGISTTIAADGNALEFLKKEFPHLKSIKIPDLKIKYYTKLGAKWSILLSYNKISKQIKKENKFLQEIVKKNGKFHIIISDNRYGLHHKDSYNVIISHQHRVVLKGFWKFLSFIPNYKIKTWLRKFHLCLIPDFQGKNNLSGKLSHPSAHQNTLYTGPLSRFEEKTASNIGSEIPIVFSGPDPLKTHLIDKIVGILKESKHKFVVFGGNPSLKQNYKTHNINFMWHAESNQIEKAIDNAPLVISTGGYSSIMDIYLKNKKAIFVPFKGQTEQIYISEHLNSSKLFTFVQWKKLGNLEDKIDEILAKNFVPRETNYKPTQQQLITTIIENYKNTKCKTY